MNDPIEVRVTLTVSLWPSPGGGILNAEGHTTHTAEMTLQFDALRGKEQPHLAALLRLGHLFEAMQRDAAGDVGAMMDRWRGHR